MKQGCNFRSREAPSFTDKKDHENVLKQIKQKDDPDFVDPEDTITIRDLDDDFAAAEMENLISELST